MIIRIRIHSTLLPTPRHSISIERPIALEHQPPAIRGESTSVPYIPTTSQRALHDSTITFPALERELAVPGSG